MKKITGIISPAQIVAFVALSVGMLQLAYAEDAASAHNAQAADDKSEPAAAVSDRRAVTGAESAFANRNPRYKVQRDDVMALSFPLSPEMNQTVTVQPDGYIDLQAGQSIHVQGLTVPEIVAAIKKAYAHILNQPIVNVSLTDYQKPFFVVSGQVAKPGQYFMRYNMTVAEAIAVGGGLMPTAKTQVFLFRKDSNNWAEVRELKLNDVVNGKDGREDIQVKPGDMIFVPEKKIVKLRKYVPYGMGMAMSLNPAVFY